AGTIGMTVNALATLGLARWLHGAPDLGGLLAAATRAVAIALIPSIPLAYLTRGHAVQTGRDALLWLRGAGGFFSTPGIAGVFILGDQPTRQTLRRWLGMKTTDNTPSDNRL